MKNQRVRESATKHLSDLVGGPLDGQRFETDNPLDSVEHGGDPDAYRFYVPNEAGACGELVNGRRQLVWKGKP